jgi:hypothetical protein
MSNGPQLKRKSKARQDDVARIRARIAANHAADDAIRRRALAIDHANGSAWPPPPEWFELNRQRDALRERGHMLSEQLSRALPHSSAEYDRDAGGFYCEPARWIAGPRRALVRYYIKTGRTVMIDGERVPLVEFVR